MLSKGEAAALLSLINAHHGNAQWDDVQLDAFHSELRSDITAAEAREAVRRFYADNSTGRWCGSGDINGIVRKLRNGAKPSEAQIGRECERLGLVEDQAWLRWPRVTRCACRPRNPSAGVRAAVSIRVWAWRWTRFWRHAVRLNHDRFDGIIGSC